jgi:RIP metalloprotease RseP
LNTIISIIEFILALGTIILLHEFGHFIVGRISKIDGEEFGIGFPPRALKLFTWKGTLFTLNWIPFGGFCRFKGEEDPQAPGGLSAANKWARLATLLGGPAMNLILASILFAVVNWYASVQYCPNNRSDHRFSGGECGYFHQRYFAGDQWTKNRFSATGHQHHPTESWKRDESDHQPKW